MASGSTTTMTTRAYTTTSQICEEPNNQRKNDKSDLGPKRSGTSASR
jgi:hypothetical protein